MKQCITCGSSYPIDKFTKNRTAKSGYGSKCLSCEAIRSQGKRRKNPASAREAQLRSRYGITSGVYLDLAIGQGNRCKLCLKTNEVPLHVDHCHKSGNIRGLLCRPCNTALGMFQDNIEVLARAIRYLEEAKTKIVPKL